MADDQHNGENCPLECSDSGHDSTLQIYAVRFPTRESRDSGQTNFRVLWTDGAKALGAMRSTHESRHEEHIGEVDHISLSSETGIDTWLMIHHECSRQPPGKREERLIADRENEWWAIDRLARPMNGLVRPISWLVRPIDW